jgi:Tfp pilus assembly protein PilZ
MYFKSLFELYPGTHIRIRMDDYTSDNDQVAAKVVWCKELKDSSTFRYGVGVEFLQAPGNSVLKAVRVRPTAQRTKPPNTEKGGVVIHMRQTAD